MNKNNMNIFKKIQSFFAKKEIKKEYYKQDITCTIIKSLYNPDQKIGLNFSSFILITDKDIFQLNDRIESELGILCKVIKTFKIEGYNHVEVILLSDDSSNYCPATELKIGKQWKVQTKFFNA